MSAQILLALFMAVPAGAATLGRGMQQLVELYENGSPKLSSALGLHIARPDNQVLVHVHLAPGADADQTLSRLKDAGFRLQARSLLDPTLHEGYLPLAATRTVVAVPGVTRILAVQRPHALVGSVQSQAVAVEKADLAQARGVDGTGIRLGALSDSYNSQAAFHPNADDDVASGDLPAAGVTVLEDLGPGEGADEGRAMLQLVHDLAPGAQLGFATAFNGPVDFSNNILNLRRTFHADVIVDDVIYFDEPMYSDGLLAQTVDQVVSEGAAYFSSAGNNGLEAYESAYRAVSLDEARGLVAAGKENLDLDALVAFGYGTAFHVHDFRNADRSPAISQRLTSYFGDFISFQWDEPFGVGKVQTDFDMVVFDADGHFLDPFDPSSPVFYTLDYNPSTDEAFEFLFVSPGTYQFAIVNSNNGPARHVKYVDVNGTGESARQNAPSIWGHAAASRGQAVAGMYYGITNFPEDFSSPGPVTIYFDTTGRRLEEPEVRRVPQITGIDGVDTTFFGFDLDGNGNPNFFGTSAAAPDVAAVAALVLESSGGPGSMRPSRVYDRLQKTATPVPLSRDRTHALAVAGPLSVLANGDFPRETNYWQLQLLPFTGKTVSSVAIDLTKPDLRFSSPASPIGFQVGTTQGLTPADVTATRSADRTTLTLTFAPGAFGPGDFLTFANFAFPTQLPVQFQVDADRLEGGQVVVTFSDGSTRTGTFFVEPKERQNAFTGAGLVNADAAVKSHP